MRKVGKSSLVNALLNEERVIVSDVAGTTRDSIDTSFKYENNEYILIDTAGLRKKGRVYESVEKYSLLRSMKAIDRSDVCILVINAEDGIIEHDKHIAGYAIDAGKGIVIVVNKWDKVENDYDKWKKDIPICQIILKTLLIKLIAIWKKFLFKALTMLWKNTVIKMLKNKHRLAMITS